MTTNSLNFIGLTTTDEIKKTLQDGVLAQWQMLAGQNLTEPSIANELLRDITDERAGLLQYTQIDMVLRQLFAEHALLKKTAIFPIFDYDAVLRNFRDLLKSKVPLTQKFKDNIAKNYVAELSTMEANPYNRANSPLPLATIKASLIATHPDDPKRVALELDAEIARRSQMEALVLAECEEYLATLSRAQIFRWYLEAMSADPHLMGNPANISIDANLATEKVIPIRRNGNHYGTIVVNVVGTTEARIINAQFYDGMGSDLDDDLKTTLIDFLQGPQKHQVNYQYTASPRQQDLVNCGPLAIFKSFDLVSAIVNNPIRFLNEMDGAAHDKWNDRFAYLRRVTLRLYKKAFGIIDPEYRAVTPSVTAPTAPASTPAPSTVVTTPVAPVVAPETKGVAPAVVPSVIPPGPIDPKQDETLFIGGIGAVAFGIVGLYLLPAFMMINAWSLAHIITTMAFSAIGSVVTLGAYRYYTNPDINKAPPGAPAAPAAAAVTVAATTSAPTVAPTPAATFAPVTPAANDANGPAISLTTPTPIRPAGPVIVPGFTTTITQPAGEVVTVTNTITITDPTAALKPK
jgi:hypothetical protein